MVEEIYPWPTKGSLSFSPMSLTTPRRKRSDTKSSFCVPSRCFGGFCKSALHVTSEGRLGDGQNGLFVGFGRIGNWIYVSPQYLSTTAEWRDIEMCSSAHITLPPPISCSGMIFSDKCKSKPCGGRGRRQEPASIPLICVSWQKGNDNSFGLNTMNLAAQL